MIKEPNGHQNYQFINSRKRVYNFVFNPIKICNWNFLQLNVIISGFKWVKKKSFHQKKLFECGIVKSVIYYLVKRQPLFTLYILIGFCANFFAFKLSLFSTKYFHYSVLYAKFSMPNSFFFRFLAYFLEFYFLKEFFFERNWNIKIAELTKHLSLFEFIWI